MIDLFGLRARWSATYWKNLFFARDAAIKEAHETNGNLFRQLHSAQTNLQRALQLIEQQELLIKRLKHQANEIKIYPEPELEFLNFSADTLQPDDIRLDGNKLAPIELPRVSPPILKNIA